MPINQDDVALVKSQLWSDEVVERTVRQRQFLPGGSIITPTSVIATNKRLIIVNKTTLGIRKDFEIIPYKQIVSVRLEHGVISSTVFIRVEGYDTDKGLLAGSGKQEGEIDGLKNKEAEDLADYINKKITGDIDDDNQAVKESGSSAPGFCSNCGAKLPPNSKFCQKCGAKV